MTIQDFYKELKGDYNEALKRLLNEEMATHFVKMFPADTCMQQLHQAVEDGDIETSFRAVHTLKGLSSNLGFPVLYQRAWDLTEQLRPRLDQADPVLLEALDTEYRHTLDTIKAFIGSN